MWGSSKLNGPFLLNNSGFQWLSAFFGSPFELMEEGRKRKEDDEYLPDIKDIGTTWGALHSVCFKVCTVFQSVY